MVHASDHNRSDISQNDGLLTVSVSSQSGSAFSIALGERKRLLTGPSVIQSGFSGSIRLGDKESRDDEGLFIDPDGASVTLTAISDMKSGFNGNEIKLPPYDMIMARDVGQVFGLALDDERDANLYLAATSVYGLPIVGRDRNRDGVADKLFVGRSDARFMPGLFGRLSDEDPGAIYKVDGKTGEISLFASIRWQGERNDGASLGNIAFDAASRQLFVSDLQTGLVHRLDREGNILEAFDHGEGARRVAGLPPVTYDASRRLDIKDSGFDVEDPSSWGFADTERRVWGLAVHDGRLYYAVAEGPEIWSVGIEKADGAFSPDARLEFRVDDAQSRFEISDIAFGPDGSIVLAQRGARIGSFDFSRMARSRRADVLRYWPDERGGWQSEPMDYAVGFAHKYANGTGGVALGPAYSDRGRVLRGTCGSTLWTTGEALRLREDLAENLVPGGSMPVDGVQAQPLGLPRAKNSPPWMSYFLDFDMTYRDWRHSGHMGDVEISGCPGSAAETVYDYGQADKEPEPERDWWSCLLNPDLCEVPPRKACLKTRVTLVCNQETGRYEARLVATDDLSQDFDRLSIRALDGLLQSPVEDPAFPTTVKVPLADLAPGQIGQLNLCAYKGEARASGEPFDCCKATVSFRIPNSVCGEGGE